MMSHLFFHQLTLIALVWLCVMLQWVWPSDSAAARRYRSPYPHGPRASVSPPPLRASPPSHTATPVCTPPTRARKPPGSAPAYRADTGTPPPDRHFLPFLPEPSLYLSRMGGLGQSPCQWPSQWRSLAAAAVCRLSWLFSRALGTLFTASAPRSTSSCGSSPVWPRGWASGAPPGCSRSTPTPSCNG